MKRMRGNELDEGRWNWMKGNVYLKASDFPGLPLPRLVQTFPSNCTTIGKWRYRAIHLRDGYDGGRDCSGG